MVGRRQEVKRGSRIALYLCSGGVEKGILVEELDEMYKVIAATVRMNRTDIPYTVFRKEEVREVKRARFPEHIDTYLKQLFDMYEADVKLKEQMKQIEDERKKQKENLLTTFRRN